MIDNNDMPMLDGIDLDLDLGDDDLILTLDTPDHYENLVGKIEQSKEKRIAQDVINWLREDEAAQKKWIDQEKAALKALGLGDEALKPDYEGASTAIHPLFVEAVEQFHNRSLVELRPANGDYVKTEIVGEEDELVRAQSLRVKEFMNFLYTKDMVGEFNEQDRLLFRLPISGSCFKKVGYCKRTKKFYSTFIPPEDVIVPWNATSLKTAHRFIHRYRDSHAVFMRNVASGFYVGDSVIDPQHEEVGEIREVILQTDGKTQNSTAEVAQHTILACYCTLDIEDGYDYPMEYIVWVEQESQEVIRIQRNWKPNDDTHCRFVDIIHYPFVQGLGFYGHSLYQLLRGSIDATTDLLQGLIDTANDQINDVVLMSRFAKLPLTEKGEIKKGSKTKIKGRMYVECDGDPDSVRNGFVQPPKQTISPVPMQTMQYIDTRAKEMAGVSGVLTGDASLANAPVGTVLALIEQGSVQFSAIYQRLHNAQTQEFRLMAEIVAENIPETGYPYAIKGKNNVIMASDFDNRIDIYPVSSPDAVSKSQRIIQANALAELTTTKFPNQIQPRWVLQQTLDAMRITVPEEAWIEDKANPLEEAEVEKVKAETEKLRAEKANTNADTQFSLIQTANMAVQNAAVLPVGDELGKSAGYVDENEYPLANEATAQGIPAQPMPIQQNTHPQFPANPIDPMSDSAGINTVQNEPI